MGPVEEESHPAAAPPLLQEMPTIKGFRPTELEQLLESIANSDRSVFNGVPPSVLSAAADKLTSLVDPDGPGMEWKKAVDGHSVTLVTASWCPLCQTTQKLLEGLKLPDFHVFEVDKVPGMGDKAEQKKYLAENIKPPTNEHRVPQLFIKGKYIGEFDDIVDEKGGNVLWPAIVSSVTSESAPAAAAEAPAMSFDFGAPAAG